MNRIVIDRSLVAKLDEAGWMAEFCDDTGRVVGYFKPVHDLEMYEGVEPRISKEEFDRRVKEGGRSLKEIIADPEKR